MKSQIILIALGMMAGTAAFGQVQDASVCDVINHPTKFDGKVVRVKGTVQASFDSMFVKGDSCEGSLWLSYPAGTKAKSGPAAILTLQLASNGSGTPGAARPAVVLEKNADWTTFDTLLSARPKTPGMCLGCVKNEVTATMIGRVDGVEEAGVMRGNDGKITRVDGFGNLNGYTVRLVLQSVSGAVAQEIDYAKAPKVSGDSASGGDKDFMGANKKAQTAFAKDSDPVKQIQRAIDAYGAQGADNGVNVGFGGVADVPAGEGSKAAKASPDGLMYNMQFDTEKLKGDALSRAIAHQGAEVASMREGKTSPSQIEANAWQTVLYTTIGSRQKSLTLPGGYVIWDSTWAQADATGKAGEALTGFLQTHELTPR